MRRRGAGALLVATVCSVVVGLVGAAPAAAHPLGNFTVNRYARVEVGGPTVRVLYVLDLAEIPSFQAREELEADPGRYAADESDRIRGGLRLEVDGRPLELRVVDRRLSRPDGQAGLPTTRLVVLLEAQLPAGARDGVHDARFVDGNGDERIGWREVVVSAPGDGEIVDSSVPASDVTDELRDYPEDRLQSPLDVREATFRFRAGDEQPAPPSLDGGSAGTRRADRFTDLLDRQDLTPLVLAGMLAVAVVVGVGHALAPGHGKTVMAAYLIGTRGRPVDAVLLGVIVSAMHTASVLVLGIALHQVDERFALDSVYPVLTLASGVGVLLVGLWLATTRTRTLRRRRHASSSPTGDPHALAHGGDHGHADHDHGEHDHGHGHGNNEHDHGHGHGHNEHGHGHGEHEHGHGHDVPQQGDGRDHDHVVHVDGHHGHGHGHGHGNNEHDHGHGHGHGHGNNEHGQLVDVHGSVAHGHDHEGRGAEAHDHVGAAHGHDDDHGDVEHSHGDADRHADRQDRGAAARAGAALAGGGRDDARPVVSLLDHGPRSSHDHAAAGRGGAQSAQDHDAGPARRPASQHGHGHGHVHGPGGHSHDLPEGVAPLSRRGLVLLATAGGVVPSPSAVIVLVSAFALGRTALGLALVAAFSVGLAATLTVVGLALVFGSRALGDRVSERLVRVFPVAGAVALLALGVVLTVQGVRGL